MTEVFGSRPALRFKYAYSTY